MFPKESPPVIVWHFAAANLTTTWNLKLRCSLVYVIAMDRVSRCDLNGGVQWQKHEGLSPDTTVPLSSAERFGVFQWIVLVFAALHWVDLVRSHCSQRACFQPHRQQKSSEKLSKAKHQNTAKGEWMLDLTFFIWTLTLPFVCWMRDTQTAC